MLALCKDFCFRPVPEAGDLLVSKTHPLCNEQLLCISDILPQTDFFTDDILQLPDEKRVDLSGKGKVFWVVSSAKELCNGIDAVIRSDFDIVQQVFPTPVIELRHMQMIYADLQRPDSFQQAFLKGAPDTHDFAGSFHLGTQRIVGICELIKWKPGHLGDYIVQRRLKGCRCVGDRNLVQRHAHGNFGADSGDGIAAGLGCKCGGAGHTRIDFNQIVLEALRVQRKLYVTAALDLQCPNDLQGAVPEHMIFFVGQRLRGTYHDRVAGVDAHRIQIFHVADGDGGVIDIPHHLVFDFLKALDGFLHQHLMHRRKCKGIFHDFTEFRFVIGKTAAGAAQCKGGTQHHRVADLACNGKAFIHGIRNIRGQNRLTEGFAQLLE